MENRAAWSSRRLERKMQTSDQGGNGMRMESGGVVGQEIEEAGHEKRSSKSWCGSPVGPDAGT
jgi:hypothetical protein